MAYAQIVVGDKEELELGQEFEPLTAHEPGCDLVAAGHALDFGFIELSSEVGFDRGQAQEAQTAEIIDLLIGVRQY